MISIHAPHAGSDGTGSSRGAGPANFNPRSPCGERRLVIIPGVVLVRFQSTLPMRGATVTNLGDAAKAKISIHAPHAGSDQLREFYRRRRRISIHAPHAGSDPASASSDACVCRFQSTLPMRGATWHIRQSAGSPLFQSTLPMRGATHWDKQNHHIR